MHWRHKGSHLHNNDASLVSRSAHVLCWQCALALGLSVRGPGRASPAVWLAGFAPLAACLAMTHVAVFRLTPNAAGRPSVTSYAYGLYTATPPPPPLPHPHHCKESQILMLGLFVSVQKLSSITLNKLHDNKGHILILKSSSIVQRTWWLLVQYTPSLENNYTLKLLLWIN